MPITMCHRAKPHMPAVARPTALLSYQGCCKSFCPSPMVGPKSGPWFPPCMHGPKGIPNLSGEPGGLAPWPMLRFLPTTCACAIALPGGIDMLVSILFLAQRVFGCSSPSRCGGLCDTILPCTHNYMPRLTGVLGKKGFCCAKKF